MSVVIFEAIFGKLDSKWIKLVLQLVQTGFELSLLPLDGSRVF